MSTYQRYLDACELVRHTKALADELVGTPTHPLALRRACKAAKYANELYNDLMKLTKRGAKRDACI